MLLKNQFADDQPGKGLSFYRKTGEQKMKHITYGQYVLVGLILVSLVSVFLKMGIFYAITFGISGILVLQYIFKRRISLHTKIDDASLVETKSSWSSRMHLFVS